MYIRILLLFLTIPASLLAQRGELYIQAGHTNQINAIAISADNSTIATGSIDNSIRVWDAHSGKLLRILNNKDAVYCLTFLRNGQQLVSGGYGINTDAVKIWDLESGSYSTIDWNKGLMALSTTRDGRYLAAGSSNGYVVLYDQSSGEVIRSYDLGKRESVKTIAFDPSGELMAAGTGAFFVGNTLKLYKTKGDSLIASYSFDNSIKKVEFLNEQQILVETTQLTDLNSVLMIDLNKGVIDTIAEMSALSVLPDGSGFLGMTDNYEISYYSADSSQLVRTLSMKERSISGMTTDSEGKVAYTYGRGMEAISLETDNAQLFYTPGDYWIEAMSFSSKGNQMAFNAANGDIVHWDLETGELSNWVGHAESVEKLAFSDDGAFLASAGRDSMMLVWNAEGEVVFAQKFHDSEFGDITCDPSSSTLTISLNDSVYSFGLPDNGLQNAISFGEFDIDHMLYSPNGSDFAMLIYNYVLVWDMAEGVYQLEEPLGTASLEDISFSSDGRYLAVSGYTDSLYVFDLDSQRIAYQQPIKGNYVHSLDFDPKSLRLAVGFDDGTVAIIDIGTGEELIRFDEHKNLVNEVSFRADGEVLASSSWDGKLVIYDALALKKLADLYAFEDNTWAVVDVDGRYDASNAGNIDHLHYVVKQTAIGLDQLKQRFYEPGLLQKLLGYKDEPLRNVQRLAEIKLFPEIDLSINGNELAITVSDQGGGFGKIQLFVNDKELVEDLDINSFEQLDSLSYGKVVDLMEFERFLKKENSLGVQAYNEAGFLVSPRNSLSYVPFYPMPPPAEPVYIPGSDSFYVDEIVEEEPGGFGWVQQPQLYAIIVGTSDYAGDQLDLQFADKDAAAFSDALYQTGATLFGEESVHIQTFKTDDTSALGLPLKSNIQQAFKKLAGQAHPMDILVVYMSGHGMTYNDEGLGQFHYLTMDVTSGELEDEDVRMNQTISSEELTDWIKDIPVEKQVLIIDACASGQAIEDILMAQKNVTSGQIRALERMKDRTGMFILTGSASDKVSFEASRFGQSLLTYSILSGIKGQALRDGEFVDVLQLFEHAVERVPELAAYIGGIQKPILAVPYGGNSFDIGRVNDSVHIELAAIKPVFIRSNFQDEFEYADVLALSEQIDARFRHISARSKSTDFIFVDVNRYPDAYSIKGRYQSEGELIDLSARVFKGKEMVGEFDLQGKADGVDRLVEDVIVRAQQLISEH